MNVFSSYDFVFNVIIFMYVLTNIFTSTYINAPHQNGRLRGMASVF
jgi:hypothetical protein